MPADPAPLIKPVIAVPVGDPNGIGPEIALKAALDDQVRACARVILVADPPVLEATARRLGCESRIAGLVEDGEIGLEAVAALNQAPDPGTVSAAAGRACVAYACHAIALARAGTVAAVVAAPHNETAVADAGIPFAGYPGLLAREMEVDPDKVFLMLVGPAHRIVHVTLHLGLRAALDAITTERVLDAARAADRALKMIGITAPSIGACGINPHAGEGGIFGDEDERIVRPAVEAAQREGIALAGPMGADVLLAEGAHDAYLAMYHDQGHIPIKLAGRGNACGLAIGTPVLFSSVAHGSAHDIAGAGTADAAALIGTVIHMAQILNTGK